MGISPRVRFFSIVGFVLFVVFEFVTAVIYSGYHTYQAGDCFTTELGNVKNECEIWEPNCVVKNFNFVRLVGKHAYLTSVFEIHGNGKISLYLDGFTFNKDWTNNSRPVPCPKNIENLLKGG